MSDLLKRLRAKYCCTQGCTCEETADRIEELERELSAQQEAEPVAWPGPGRFTDLTARLRRCAEIIATGMISEGQVIWLGEVVVDAALKIEALERDIAHPAPAPAVPVDLIERLEAGVPSCGLHEDNSTEMYAVDVASETMWEAAQALRAQPAPQVKAMDATAERELMGLWRLSGSNLSYEGFCGRILSALSGEAQP